MGEISNISFRRNNEFNIYGDLNKIVPNGIMDFYTLSFLKGLTYTSNCYSCRFAQIKRVSDITLGDAWGSCLPDDQQRKGISMALCQTNKGKKLLHSADLVLYPFDISTAIESNHQLDYIVGNLYEGFLNYLWCIKPKIRRKFKMFDKRMVLGVIVP